jgi:excisionase family DNA binding protein
MTPGTYERLDDLPDVMTPQDLIAFLPLGRNAIYELLQEQRIKSVRVGQKFIIPKTALRDFLGGVSE